MRFRTRIAPVVLALSLVTASAFAQSDADKATARQLGTEGQEAIEKKDFKTAEDRFRRADQLYHAPTLALGLARSYAANGKYVEAQETYNRIIREGAPAGSPAAFANAVEAAKTEINSVSGKVGSVVINVTGVDSPKVTVDDQPFPAAALGVRRAANPGNHVIRASADGYKPAEARVTVTEGGSSTANLTLEKDPNAAVSTIAVPQGTATGQNSMSAPPASQGETSSSPTKTIGIVLMGVGAAGLVAGGVTGIMAMGKHSDLNDACPGGQCPASKQSDVDSYKTMGTISTIGFIAGGVLVAGGAVLFFTAPKERQSASSPHLPLVAIRKAPAPSERGFVRPVVGPLSVGAIGRF